MKLAAAINTEDALAWMNHKSIYLALSVVLSFSEKAWSKGVSGSVGAAGFAM